MSATLNLNCWVRQGSGVLNGVTVGRIVFTEVTKRAVQAALAQPRPVPPLSPSSALIRHEPMIQPQKHWLDPQKP